MITTIDPFYADTINVSCLTDIWYQRRMLCIFSGTHCIESFRLLSNVQPDVSSFIHLYWFSFSLSGANVCGVPFQFFLRSASMSSHRCQPFVEQTLCATDSSVSQSTRGCWRKQILETIFQSEKTILSDWTREARVYPRSASSKWKNHKTIDCLANWVSSIHQRKQRESLIYSIIFDNEWKYLIKVQFSQCSQW